MKRNHGIIGPNQLNTISGTKYQSSASGIFDLYDQNLVSVSAGNWPAAKSIQQIIAPTPTQVTEAGAAYTFTVYGGRAPANSSVTYGGSSGWAASDLIYYSIVTTAGATITNGDIQQGVGQLNSVQGVFSFANDGDASVQVSIQFKAEYPADTENNKFRLDLFSDSARLNLLASSPEVDIIDVAGSPNKSVHVTLKENRYGSNMGTIYHYLTDNTGAIIHTFGTTSGNYGSATWLSVDWSTNADILSPGTQFHLCWLHIAGNSYRADYAIDEVRLYMDGSNVETWGFESTTDGAGTGGFSGYSGWRHANQTQTLSSTTAFNVNSPLQQTTATGRGIWNVTSGSTGSNSTGPNSAYQGTYYCYTETSGPSSGYHWLFSEQLTVPN